MGESEKTMMVNADDLRKSFEFMDVAIIRFEWSTSHGETTYGMHICKAYINGRIVGRCVGLGYDMQGVALANFLNNAYREELIQLGRAGFEMNGFRYSPATDSEKENVYFDGGCGLESVRDVLEKIIGVKIYGIWSREFGQEYVIVF